MLISLSSTRRMDFGGDPSGSSVLGVSGVSVRWLLFTCMPGK
jgi:hypothetical protein